MRTPLLILSLPAALAINACGPQSTPDPETRDGPHVVADSVSAADLAQIPAEPPESLFADAYSESDIDRTGSFIFPRNIVQIEFAPHATHAQKATTILAIGGTVVGGSSLSPEGIYIVRIKDDGTSGPLRKVIGELRQNPSVRKASEHVLLGPHTTN